MLVYIGIFIIIVSALIFLYCVFRQETKFRLRWPAYLFFGFIISCSLIFAFFQEELAQVYLIRFIGSYPELFFLLLCGLAYICGRFFKPYRHHFYEVLDA